MMRNFWCGSGSVSKAEVCLLGVEKLRKNVFSKLRHFSEKRKVFQKSNNFLEKAIFSDIFSQIHH